MYVNNCKQLHTEVQKNDAMKRCSSSNDTHKDIDQNNILVQGLARLLKNVYQESNFTFYTFEKQQHTKNKGKQNIE